MFDDHCVQVEQTLATAKIVDADCGDNIVFQNSLVGFFLKVGIKINKIKFA